MKSTYNLGLYSNSVDGPLLAAQCVIGPYSIVLDVLPILPIFYHKKYNEIY